MPLKRGKHISSVCHRSHKNRGRKVRYWWLIWLSPLVGLLALVWFLIRVLPKPSRATYPCQRVAAPLASSFVVWLTGLICSTLAYRKARRLFRQSRYVVAGLCVAAAVMAVWWSASMTGDNPARAASFTPSDPANSPMGVPKGIHPARVFWVHDPNATSWNGSTGYWWDDSNTDQEVVDSMISKAIRGLVSETNDAVVWDMLFRHFNRSKGKGDVGYQPGEKIVVKINMNNWGTSNEIDASPHMVRGLLRQLVYQAGVAQSAITVYDAQRDVGSPVYNYCYPEFPGVGYNANVGWVSNAITYSAEVTSSEARRLPQCVLDAEYMINMAILKRHDSHAAVTLCAKNHFGTIGSPSALHQYVECWDRGMGAYDPLVDIMGNANMGGKTVLYIIDGLYGGNSPGATPTRWYSQPFNGHWPSSMFASQDPVAVDSVGLDFLRAEWTLKDNADNYLHEAAQADDPASGTFYDSEADGTRMSSLGVHEHWDNPADKQYSRNLGTGEGIELLARVLPSADGPIENLATGKKYDHIQDAIDDALDGEQIVADDRTYDENINFKGKTLTVRSTDPNDPAVMAATVINGGAHDPAVTFSAGADANCVLAGFTITGGSKGLFCFDASPTIAHCTIDEAGGIAVELWHESEPIFIDCTIIGDVIVRAIENLTTGQSYDYIQDAIDHGANGDQIVVSWGTYQENVDFKGKNLTVRSTEPTDPMVVAATVIDGGAQGPVVTFSSGENAGCLLSGFTIIDGNSIDGGGISCIGSSPTISHCVISNNRNTDNGGGMRNAQSSNPTLLNCTFSNNTAYYGGGIANDSSSPTLTNCVFINNTADWQGGAMDNNYECNPTLTNCTFRANSAERSGGAISNYDNSSQTVTNCTFAGNSATNGSALACDSFVHSYPSTVQATNCIFWDGGDEISNADGSVITITYSCVQDLDPNDGSVYPGTGNIDDDPGFVDANGPDGIVGTEDDNLRLLADSNCIDAGDNAALPADTADLDGDGNTVESTPWDLDGRARIVDGDCDCVAAVDMGAYEFGYIGDTDCNQLVNVADFAILALAWLTEPGDANWNPCCDVSIPADNYIDRRDLYVFTDNWLAGAE